MKVAKFIKPRTHEFIDMPIPTIDNFEVLIEVLVCGLCASELHVWKTGDNVDANAFMGHEVVGIVVDKGINVTTLAIGDRVTGLIYHGFAEYTKAHHSQVIKVPDSLSVTEALGEPLGCLVSGARNTRIELGDRLAVVGAGYMGLGALQLLQIKGVSQSYILDIRGDTMSTAKDFGAIPIKLPSDIVEKEKVTAFGVNMDGGYDVVVEASGTEAGLVLAGEIAGLHKTVSIVGFHQGDKRTLDIGLWNWKAIQVVNAHERRTDYMMDCITRGLLLIENKRINMASLCTHVFCFEDIDQGFSAFEQKTDRYIKGVIEIKKEGRSARN